MADTSNVIISKGIMDLINTERSNLIEANSTHDGVVFVFKGGIHLYCTDTYMPQGTKELICNTANRFEGVDLIFDLSNYNKPVVARKK